VSLVEKRSEDVLARTAGWDKFFMDLTDEFWNELDDESRSLLSGEPIPEDVRRAACMVHPYPVGWFDNPIPNLDGRSARQVLARRGGADKIRAILMEVAPAFLPDAQLFKGAAKP
jgi:hypothetical protein